jgi:ferrous iron transport protein A
MKLKDMHPGARGRITGYGDADRDYRQKLLRMGLIKGAPFTFVRAAPMGDPVEISIRGYSLSLRKAEADALDVEVVE